MCGHFSFGNFLVQLVALPLIGFLVNCRFENKHVIQFVFALPQIVQLPVDGGDMIRSILSFVSPDINHNFIEKPQVFRLGL
ncbi:MAG: hypothetical protein AB7P14_28365 [Blastocatellales bacterium]